MIRDDIKTAFAFLTIIPTRHTPGTPARAVAYFPVVGVVIGALLAVVASTGVLSRDVVALLVLGTWIVVTGGLHLDGFGDSCDGLLATTTPERRLEIMRDPRAGSWAVVGLVVLLLGKWIVLRHVDPLLLVLPPVLGRWAMVLAIWSFPYARSSGLGALFREGLTIRHILIATGVTAVAVFGVSLVVGGVAQIAFLLVPILVWLVGHWAARRLGGGLTGDVYGALCVLTELMALIVLSRG